MSRKPQDLTPGQKAVVGVVSKAARQRARVNGNYVNAILSAREQGVTYAAIALAAGTSSQAVQEIVRRHRQKQPGGWGIAGSVAAIAGPEGETPRT